MRILTGPQISSILRNLSKQDGEKLLNALAGALATYTSQQHNPNSRLHQPLRTVIQTSRGHTSLFMPVSDESITAVKVATVPKQGDIKGAITLYSEEGELLGLLNAAEITAFRTALATMTVLTKWTSASGDSEHSAVVFGAGKQAEWHVRLILLLIPKLKRISIVNRSSERLQRFMETVTDQLAQTYPKVQFEGVQKIASMQNGLDLANIICCCTPSTEPLFTWDRLKSEKSPPKRFLSLIGSYKPEMQEIDSATLWSASQVIVDSKEACLAEAGELIRAKMGREDLIEVGNLFQEDGQQKINDEGGLTLFKCVGMGLMDLTISQALLEIAEDKNQGSTIDEF